MRILFILFVLYTHCVQAQTTIPSGNVSGTWTKANSPYLVQGEINVAKGNTLTLEPGTVLEFNGNYGITVNGVLNSVGAKGDSIQFKSSAGLAWAGISFVKNFETDTIRFKYCRFDNICDGFPRNDFYNYAIQCINSSVLVVENSSFYYNTYVPKQGGDIYCRRGFVNIKNCYFQSSASKIESHFGLVCIDTCLGFDVSNLVFNTKFNAINGSGDLVFLNCIKGKRNISGIRNLNNSSISMAITSSSNIVVDNLDFKDKGSLYLDGTNLKISKSKFVNSAATAIKTFDNCTGTIIEDCYFENCGFLKSNFVLGTLSLSSSGPLFNRCKFKNNSAGMDINQKYGSATSIFLNCEFDGFTGRIATIEGYPVFINCNFTNNTDRYRRFSGLINPPYTGGILVIREFDNSRPYFYNCLFWGNRDSFGHSNSFYLEDKTVKVDLNYCLLQGDSAIGIVGVNTNDESVFRPTSPQLTYNNSSGITPGFEDSATGNYQLLNTCSKMGGAVNKGMRGNLLTQYPFNILNNTYGINIYNATDLAGNPRVVDDTLDIGCYESQGNKRVLKVQSSISDTSICYGANLSVQSKTIGYVQNYTWQEKQGTSITNISNSKTLNLVNAKAKNKQYRLVLSSTACLPLKDSSNWFTVQVKSPIKKGIVKNPNKDSIQLNETMLLSTNATGYNSFLWSNGGNTSSTSFKGSDLGALGSHQITLEARNINGCLETDTVYIYTKANSSIHQSLNQAGIRLYPSPANTILSIECNEPLTIEIYDLNGQLLFNQNTEASISQLNIEELRQGVYFVKLRKANKEELVVKLIKD